MSGEERNALIMRAYEVYSAANAATTPAFLAMMESVKKGVKSYTFKHRMKSSQSIEAKVRRKRELGQQQLTELELTDPSCRDADWLEKHEEASQNATYSPDHVTDVLGCRYVTLYQSEIPAIVEELLKVIESHNTEDNNSPIDGYEFVIYTNRVESDPLAITNDTLRIVQRSKLFDGVAHSIRPPESKKSAYSSVHFVFGRHIDIQHPGKDVGRERSFFEVQIRDIFEEGWGEIQHDLLYSEKDKPVTDSLAPLAEQAQWSLHLNALKTFVDGCSQHASIIKANLEILRAAYAPTIANQSVSERKSDQANVIEALHRVRAEKDVEEAASLGYSLLLSVSDLPDGEDTFRRLLDAASNFDSALAKLPQGHRDAQVRHSGKLTIGYFLAMEAAAARIVAAEHPNARGNELARENELQLRREAEQIYEDLAKRFPKDPTVHMRLARLVEQRAASIADFERAVELFEHTINHIADDPTTGNDHWIAISSRMDKGTSIWKQIRFRSDGLATEERIALIGHAREITRDAFQVWQLQSPSGNELNKMIGHKAAANVVFYVAALHECGSTLTADDLAELATMIDFVEDHGSEHYPDWFKTRDNLVHGYRVLGDYARRDALAMDNVVELRALAEQRAGHPLDLEDVRTYLTGSELICFDTAMEVFTRSDD